MCKIVSNPLLVFVFILQSLPLHQLLSHRQIYIFIIINVTEYMSWHDADTLLIISLRNNLYIYINHIPTNKYVLLLHSYHYCYYFPFVLRYHLLLVCKWSSTKLRVDDGGKVWRSRAILTWKPPIEVTSFFPSLIIPCYSFQHRRLRELCFCWHFLPHALVSGGNEGSYFCIVIFHGIYQS